MYSMYMAASYVRSTVGRSCMFTNLKNFPCASTVIHMPFSCSICKSATSPTACLTFQHWTDAMLEPQNHVWSLSLVAPGQVLSYQQNI